MDQVTIIVNLKSTNSQKEILTTYKYENVYIENDVFTFIPINDISNKIIIYYIMSMFTIGNFNNIFINDYPKFEDGSIIKFSYIMHDYLKSDNINKKIYITI